MAHSAQDKVRRMCAMLSRPFIDDQGQKSTGKGRESMRTRM